MSRTARTTRTLVAAPRDLERCLASLSVFESLAASGRLVVTLVDSDPASLLYATLLRHRLRDHADRVAVPLCLHRDALSAAPRLESDRLRTLDLDEAVILSGSFLDGIRASAAGVPRRWGYGGFRPLTPLLRPSVKRPSAAAGPHEHGRPLVEAMGLPWVERRRLEITDGWRELGERRLREAKIEGDDPVIGVFTGRGSGGGEWPRKAWESLLRELRRRRPAVRLVLLSTDDELWTSVRLHESTGRIHPVIGPELDLPGQAAVIHRLDLVVGPAGAWMLPLARAVGTATVAVSGRGKTEAEVVAEAEEITHRFPP